jgi:NAD(P)-dependent dehydrogenase (short-subunit alcohol dehydrogenase family)
VARSAEYGDRVDVLVNAQNVLHWTSIEDSSAAQWNEALRTNLLGPIMSAKAFLPLLKKADPGAIVLIGSVDGTLGNARVPTYSVSKGGLVPLTHVMADEFAAFGIRVNCVARAAVAADPPNEEIARQISRTIEATPLRRAATPHEVASAVAMLACADLSYVTGTVLVVDGGRTGLTPGCSL